MNKGKSTIKDIARVAGVSVGTVSKFLNGAGGIKEANRVRIQKAIEQLDYTANSVARMLARNPICLGVLIPSDFGDYFDPLVEGIKTRVESLADQKVSAIYGRYVNYNDSKKIEEILADFFKAGVDGIIMAPSVSTDNSVVLRKIKASGTPVVSIISEIQDLSCVGHVMVDTLLSGEKAADMAALVTEKGRSAAVFVGSMSIPEHREKAESFISHCAKLGIRVLEVQQAHADTQVAYSLACGLIKDNSDLGFIYVATANSVSVCRAVRDSGKSADIRVMVTDILPGMSEYAKEGIIVAALDQHMHRQGELAVDLIYGHLTGDRQKPADQDVDERVIPGLLLRSAIVL